MSLARSSPALAPTWLNFPSREPRAAPRRVEEVFLGDNVLVNWFLDQWGGALPPSNTEVKSQAEYI